MSTSSARRSGVEADGGALQVLRIRGVEDKKVSHPLPYPVCGGVPSSYVLLGALFVNQRRISSRNSKRRWSGYNCAPQYLVEKHCQVRPEGAAQRRRVRRACRPRSGAGRACKARGGPAEHPRDQLVQSVASIVRSEDGEGADAGRQREQQRGSGERRVVH